MNIRNALLAVSMTTCGVLGLGCAHDETTATNSPDRHYASVQPAGGPGVTNRQPTGMDGTIDRLTTARCDRELTCGNIGDGKKYATRRVCSDQVRGSIANDLTSAQCPRGLDDAAVNQCMNAIGNEECGAHPVEALSRMDKCRGGSMCGN